MADHSWMERTDFGPTGAPRQPLPLERRNLCTG